MFQECFPSDLVLVNALFFQLLNDFDLCGNGCMVRARLPQCFVSLHSLESDEDILHGLIQCVSHMKLSCYIGRGHHNGKWFFISVYFGVEIFVVQPFLVNSVFQSLGVISFGKFLAHNLLLKMKWNPACSHLPFVCIEYPARQTFCVTIKNTLYRINCKGRNLPRYHLFFSLMSVNADYA